jgi:CarD family transcriptional regulator, regulator of rRNA transcription
VTTNSRSPERRPAQRAVGDVVVYAAHGVGRIVSREQTLVAGTERDCVVVELAQGLRVTLSHEDAAERLRPVLDDRELRGVQKTLAGQPAARDGAWTRRIKESKAKLAGGRARELAELVRDGASHEGSGRSPRLSPGERQLYLQARQLLARELCFARGLEPGEADEWIEAQLAVPGEGGS